MEFPSKSSPVHTVYHVKIAARKIELIFINDEGIAVIACESSDEVLAKVPKSVKSRTVLMHLEGGGYLLERLPRNETKVTYVFGLSLCDLCLLLVDA